MIDLARAHLPQDAVLPDYGDGGLFGFARGLRHWLHEPAAGWAHGGLEAGEQGVVVVLVVDGLGDLFLARHGQGSCLLANRRGRLSSVFPSTTASAVTTLFTGLAPAQHGLNGWFIHDHRLGGVIAPLPLVHRSGGPLDVFRLVPRLFPYHSMFLGAQRPVVVVTPADLADSRYSRHHNGGARVRAYERMDGMGEAIVEEAQRLQAGGGLVHAYYPVLDALSHVHGCQSSAAVSVFHRLDLLFAYLLDRLSGSGVTLVVTADHGFIDAPEEKTVRLALDDEVSSMLAAPLFGERRAAFCLLRAGAEESFAAWAGEALAGKAVMVPGAALLASGLLGPGEAHEELAERVGNCALLMEPGWTIVDEVEGEKAHRMIGVHGGLTADEMWVPLIRVRA